MMDVRQCPKCKVLAIRQPKGCGEAGCPAFETWPQKEKDASEALAETQLERGYP